MVTIQLETERVENVTGMNIGVGGLRRGVKDETSDIAGCTKGENGRIFEDE